MTHRAVSGNNALDWAIKFGQVECASAIIESDRWQEALQNRTRDHKFGENNRTRIKIKLLCFLTL